MARACNPALRLLPNPITTHLPGSRSKSFALHAQHPTEDDHPTELPKKVQVAQSLRRSGRRRGVGARQSLVSVGTSCGGSGDQWSSDLDLTLRQLRLDDLVEDGQRDADVLVHLLVQQHTQFGMSIKGRVVTSFRKICDSCSTPYSAKIDEQFNITVLSSSRKDQRGMPDIGISDPSVRDIASIALLNLRLITVADSTFKKVIYVRPGAEIDLDSAIQETIRLAASDKVLHLQQVMLIFDREPLTDQYLDIMQSSCSEACEKSTVVWKYGGKQKKSYSQRWSKLLDLKKTLDKAPN